MNGGQQARALRYSRLGGLRYVYDERANGAGGGMVNDHLVSCFRHSQLRS